MNKFERDSKIIMGIEHLANWSPNLKQIAEQNEIPVSTVHAVYNKLLQQNRIKLWVEVISEKEAHELFILKKAKEIKDLDNGVKYCDCGNRILNDELDKCLECR